MALGVLDGEGDLDAFAVNCGQANEVYESVKVCRCNLNQDGKRYCWIDSCSVRIGDRLIAISMKYHKSQ